MKLTLHIENADIINKIIHFDIWNIQIIREKSSTYKLEPKQINIYLVPLTGLQGQTIPAA